MQGLDEGEDRKEGGEDGAIIENFGSLTTFYVLSDRSKQ